MSHWLPAVYQVVKDDTGILTAFASIVGYMKLTVKSRLLRPRSVCYFRCKCLLTSPGFIAGIPGWDTHKIWATIWTARKVGKLQNVTVYVDILCKVDYIF